MSAGGLLPEDDELLAAELAFGLLDEGDRPAAERRIQTDAAFAAAYRIWQHRAAGLLSGAGEDVPDSVWIAIQSRLPANDPVPHRADGALRWWQAGTGLATACALVLGLLWVEQPKHAPLAPVVEHVPPLMALLRGKTDAVVAVSFDRTTHRLTTTASSLDVSPRAAELWLIPGDGTPRSLGLLDGSGARSHMAPQPLWQLIQPGATLAISLEPPGGSPSGKPTGDVILSGKVAGTST